MTGLLASMAVTCGLLLLALHLLRRMQRAGARARGIEFEVLQRISTGPKQGLALVRCGNRVLMMSCAEQGMALVTELEGDDRDAVLAGTTTVGNGHPEAAMPARRPEAAISARHPEAATPTRHPEAAKLPKDLLAVRRDPSLAALAQDDHVGGRGVVSFGARLRAAVGVGAVAIAIALPSRAAAQQPAPAPAPTAAQLQAAGAQLPAPPIPGAVKSNIVTVPKPEAGRVAAPAAPHIPVPTVNGPQAPQIQFQVGDGASGLKLSGTVGIVVMMGAMTLLPAMFLLMTSFTRILIVLHFLRTAIGTQTTPPSQLLVAISVILTGVIMTPVLEKANAAAIQPYLEGKITQVQAYQTGIQPFREFMLANTRDRDLGAFAEMTGHADAKTLDELPTMTVIAAFITGELRTSFQMGFVIFLPFVIIDLIVASVLMSMGMFMLPPLMISLPFKLLLFVLADGWTLVIKNLVASFHG